MAARGRKPKPTALKVLEGNPGKRPLNDHEPIPPKGELKCPSWLLPEGQKGMEAAGILAGGDGRADNGRPHRLRGVLSGVCTMEGSRGIHHPARQHLQNALRVCAAVPQVSIAQQNLKIMQSFCSDFGLTPATRARIIANGGGAEGRFGRSHGKAAQGRLAG